MSVSYFRPDYNFNCRLTADLQWLITFCGDKMGCSLNCGNAVTLWWTKCCIRPSFNVHFSLPADIPLLKEAWSLPGLRQHRLQSSLTVSISLLTRTDCGWQPTSLLRPPPAPQQLARKMSRTIPFAILLLQPLSTTIANHAEQSQQPTFTGTWSSDAGHWTQLQCQTKDKSWPVKRCQRSRNPVDLMYTSTRLCIIGFELSYTCLLHPGVIHCLGYLQMFQNKNRKITWDVHSWCHGTQKQNGLPSVLEKLWVMMGWARFLFFFFFFFSGTLCECCMFFSQSPRSQNEAWSLLSLSAYLFIRSASGIWINGKVFSVARCAWHLDGAASVAWVGLIGVLWFSRTCAPCLVV